MVSKGIGVLPSHGSHRTHHGGIVTLGERFRISEFVGLSPGLEIAEDKVGALLKEVELFSSCFFTTLVMDASAS